MPVAPAGDSTSTRSSTSSTNAAAAAEARHQELLRQLAAAEKQRQEQQAKAEAARRARDAAREQPHGQAVPQAEKAYTQAQVDLADTNRRIINIHRQIVQSPLPYLQNKKPDTFFTDPKVKKEFDGFDLTPPKLVDLKGGNTASPSDKVDAAKYAVTGKDSTGMWGIAEDRIKAAYADAWPPRDPPSKDQIAQYWQSVVNGNRKQFSDPNVINPGDSLHLPGITLPDRKQIDPKKRYLEANGTAKFGWLKTFTDDVAAGRVQPQDRAFKVVMSDPSRKTSALDAMRERQAALIDPSSPESKKPNAARSAASLDAAIAATDPKALKGPASDPATDATAIFGDWSKSCPTNVGTPEQQLDKVQKAIDAHKADPNYAANLLAARPNGQQSTVAELLAERLTPKLVDGYSEDDRKKVMSSLSAITDKSPAAADLLGKAIAAKLPDDQLGVDDRPMTDSKSFAGSLRAQMLDGKGVNLCASISKELNAEGHHTARDEVSKAFLDATSGLDPKDPKVAGMVPGLTAMLTNLQGYQDDNEWTTKAIDSGKKLLEANVPPSASPTAAVEESLKNHLPAAFINGDGTRVSVTVTQTDDGKYSLQLGGGAPVAIDVEPGAKVKSITASMGGIADWYSQQPSNQNDALKSLTLKAGEGPKDAAGPNGTSLVAAANADYTTGHLNFFSGDANLSKDIFDHEFGHLVGQRVDDKQDSGWDHFWGNAGEDDYPHGWEDAVKADGGPISDYAKNELERDGKPIEDFADSWAKWETAQDQGPAAVEAFKKQYPARAAILEAIPGIS